MRRDPESVSPEQYRTFYDLSVFVERWAELGLDGDDLLALRAALMAAPSAGAVVPGAGGLRKLRFAPPSRRTGKSGAVRVYYAHLADFGVIVLAVASGKSEADDIGLAQRRALARAVGAIRSALRERRSKRRRGR
jgi:hypothetical protein